MGEATIEAVRELVVGTLLEDLLFTDKWDDASTEVYSRLEPVAADESEIGVLNKWERRLEAKTTRLLHMGTLATATLRDVRDPEKQQILAMGAATAHAEASVLTDLMWACIRNRLHADIHDLGIRQGWKVVKRPGGNGVIVIGGGR